MKVLKFLHPMDLFDRLWRLKKKSIGVNFGEFSTGLCLCEAPLNSTSRIYPILAPENWRGKYVSPLEQILNQENDGKGQFRKGWFIPRLPFSPQVLNPTTMAVSEMRDVLNYLTDKEEVEYFIFGFNADEQHWNNREKFSFIRKQLQDFEDDGKIQTKFFTFADKSHSTDKVKDFFKEKFPELENKDLFLNRHHLFKNVILANPRYQDEDDNNLPEDDKNLSKDFKKHKKRMLDCYTACSFCWDFLRHCGNNILMDGGLRTEKVRVMIGYANSYGYQEQPYQFPRPKGYDPPKPKP